MLPELRKKDNLSHIILIVADTLRSGNLGLYGKRPSPSPNLDQLARKSLVFANAYATITKSDPSTAAIMSGKYPLSFGLIGHGRWLSQVQATNLGKSIFLQEILRGSGYRTAAVDWLSRWHRRGFDYYSGKLIKDVSVGNLIKNTAIFLKKWRWLDLITLRLFKRDFFVRFYYCFFHKVKYNYDPADLVVDEAIKVLTGNQSKKIFLYLRFRDTHFPNTRPRGLKSYLFDSLEKRYDAEIKFMDEQIGRLLNYLKKNNLQDKSLIIFTADHGESFLEHHTYLAHRGLYDNIVKTPLIFSHPNIPAKKIKEIVQHVDIMPTILSWLNLPCPEKIDGESLLPLISGRKGPQRKIAFFEDIVYGEFGLLKSCRRRGIRSGKYKYIKTLKGPDNDLFKVTPGENVFLAKEELYDLNKDVAERNNLAKKSPRLTRQLDGQLKEFVAHLEKKHWFQSTTD